MATRGEGHFCGSIGGYIGEKGIFVAGLVATSGELHFCDGIAGHVGRRAFLWQDG